jgi:hypothetical protein
MTFKPSGIGMGQNEAPITRNRAALEIGNPKRELIYEFRNPVPNDQYERFHDLRIF